MRAEPRSRFNPAVGVNAVVSSSLAHSSAITHAEPESPAAGHATADDKKDPSSFQYRWGREQAEEGHLLGTPLNRRAMPTSPERLMRIAPDYYRPPENTWLSGIGPSALVAGEGMPARFAS